MRTHNDEDYEDYITTCSLFNEMFNDSIHFHVQSRLLK